jgi:hypothetical protein
MRKYVVQVNGQEESQDISIKKAKNTFRTKRHADNKSGLKKFDVPSSAQPTSHFESTSAALSSKSVILPNSSIEIRFPCFPPELGPCTSVRWHKQVGEHMQEGEVIADFELMTVNIGFKASHTGYLAQIQVAGQIEGLKPKATLGLMVENQDDLAEYE